MIRVDTEQKIQEAVDYLRGCVRVYFDFETTGLDPYTAAVLLLAMHGEHPEMDSETFVFDARLGAPVFSAIRPIMEDPDIEKIAHNAVFDWKFLYHNGNIFTQPVHCTLIVEQVLQAGLLNRGFGLDDVAERRLGMKVDKSVRSGFINRNPYLDFTDEEYEYAAKDVYILPEIYAQQMAQIKKENLQPVYELEQRNIPITALMEYGGICVDQDRLRAAQPAVQAVIAKAEKQLHSEIIAEGLAEEIMFDGEGFTSINLGSTKQMLEVVQAMGVDVKSLSRKELSDWDAQWARKNKKDAKAISDSDDDDLSVGYAHPILRQHAIRTAASKLSGTYINGFLERINPVTGRIHFGFKQCGAVATGRLSGSDPNPQNLPNKKKLTDIGLGDFGIREMLIPAPGRDLIISDYSGIELAILAAMSGDKRLTYEILQGDIHSFVANNLAGEKIKYAIGDLITPKNQKSDARAKTIRDKFKPVSYGIIYGSTGYNLYRTLYFDLLSLGITITQADCDMWVERWKHELFPDTGALLQRNAEYAVTRFYTTSALGRRRRWTPEVRFDKWRMLAAMREGSNHPIQATCADMIKMSTVRVFEGLDASRARQAASVHDELVCESDKDYTDEAVPIIKEAMESSARDLFPAADPLLFIAQPKVSDKYDK